MMYLKTISIAASFLIATIFENQSYLVLLLIVAGFFLYWHLFHYNGTVEEVVPKLIKYYKKNSK